MTQQRISRKPNGHPGPNGRPNGHGPAFTERGGVLASQDRAASDDASRTPVASAAAFPAAASPSLRAGTDCETYAEVAPPAPNETARQSSGKGSRTGATSDTFSSAKKIKGKKEVPPGKYPLPETPGEFVEEIHRKVDLAEVWHTLLRSEDEKVKQRAIEKLTAMLYDDGAISSDDSEPIIFDLPRPKED